MYQGKKVIVKVITISNKMKSISAKQIEEEIQSFMTQFYVLDYKVIPITHLNIHISFICEA